MRCAVFALRDQVEHLPYHSVQTVLLDLPCLIFFSTYTLLVLFWAEIYHQARSLPTSRLRPAFFAGNALAYGMQIALWVYMFDKKEYEFCLDYAGSGRAASEAPRRVR